MTAKELSDRLAAPFRPDEVKAKPAVVQGARALAFFYVDARTIQDRLDDVLGVDGWSDDYQRLEDGSVLCRLRLRLGGEWVQKADVGGQSEQPDEGDRMKAAFSDAIKRAAVKFGIGRYLYRLPLVWADYDPQKKRWVREPAVPQAPARRAAPASPPPPAAPRVSWEEMDAGWSALGVFPAGALLAHVAANGDGAGLMASVKRFLGSATGTVIRRKTVSLGLLWPSVRNELKLAESVTPENIDRKTFSRVMAWLADQPAAGLPAARPAG
jgi:hypothetical protein